MTTDLTSKYLGFPLKNPIVASASPLTGRLDSLKRLEDAGVAAVVLPSLFEEQLDHEEVQAGLLGELGSETFPEAAGGYFPELDDYNTGPDAYLDLVREAKESLDIPVIGSLNGISVGGWIEYARLIERAGADALELNVYFIPADPELSSAGVENRYVDLVRAVRSAATIPLAVKIHPFFSAPIAMARKLAEAGADGLVLFNRFLQPRIDLATLSVRPSMELSTPAEVRLPLRWTAILRGRVAASIGATGGAHSFEDVLELVLAGADAVLLASTLLRNGPAHARALIDGMAAWLDEHAYASVEEMKGSVCQMNSAHPNVFERNNYMAALTTFSRTFEV
jgi:dihydroorotate dehydrogenase (fumarate)